jgi:hypothetical protein
MHILEGISEERYLLSFSLLEPRSVMPSSVSNASPEQMAAANALIEAIYDANKGAMNGSYGARYMTGRMMHALFHVTMH